MPTRRQHPPRHRGTLACALLALLWCAWNYCADGDGHALFWTTAFLGLAALAWPRPLPGTARSVVWFSLILIVIALAANVERLVPERTDMFRLYVIDRVVTVAFAGIGVSALFFRMHAVAVTKILLGTLPMTMLAISRAPQAEAAHVVPPPLQLWVQLGLVMLLELARQGAAPRDGVTPRFGLREWVWRGGAMAGVLLAAMLLHTPVERAVLDIQRRVLGLSLHTRRSWSPRRETDLVLSRPLPRGFGGRTRILLLADARTAPGYLRESVFTAYVRGRWQTPDAGVPLEPAAGSVPGEVTTRYMLTSIPDAAPLERIRFTVFAPRLLTGICLPGASVVLYCPAEDDPFATTNGSVHIDGGSSLRYAADISPSATRGPAFPLPDGGGDAAYLAVPATLAPAVSNWVAACPGLSAAVPPREAAARIVDDFAARFHYREDARLHPQPDPLIHFMERREGYCIHFASAAVLMLRLCGIPARLVGGFVCNEWAPWLKRWVVRERQGHAWVEAWDAGQRRWFLVEATPPVGLPGRHPSLSLFRRLQDVTIASRKGLLAAVESANLLQRLADAGAAVIRWIWQWASTAWGAAGLLAVLAGVLWHRRRSRVRLDQDARDRADLQAALARLIRRTVPKRLERLPAESWSGWLERIGPELPREARADLAARVEEYQQLRYQATVDTPRARAWIAWAHTHRPLPARRLNRKGDPRSGRSGAAGRRESSTDAAGSRE